ncbi:MAG: class II aldolase/adducin family protein [Clostridia bacterium]|nr:class II aldolase/adducin family protein [Clostridia bacterium]
MKDCVELRQEIIDTCLWLKSQGLLFSTWGNISVRLDDGNILITPSRMEYEVMRPEDLVVLSPDGEQVSGTRLATSERDIHRMVLNKRQDVGAIIHMHSTYAMAVAARNEGVPVISEEMCQLLGGAIPLSKEFVPSDMHKRLGEVVSDSVTDVNAILIRNHGPMCFGQDLKEARVCCQVVEKSCQMYLMLLAAGEFETVSDENVARGRDYYKNSYGKT